MMSTTAPFQLPSARDSGLHRANYLNHRRGILSWFITLDHKRIGMMYCVSVVAALFLGGLFALIFRTELFGEGRTILPDISDQVTWRDLYNQLFTLHGAIMVFLFIIPAIPAAMGNFVLPIMLGAKDVAFPRLNLFSYYLYAIGAVFFIVTLAAGGLDTGWTFYTPYSTDAGGVGSRFGGVIPATAGAFVLGFSSILTAVNFIASIHMLRPPGMGWFRMPLFLWGLYATSIIQILATPVLGITLLLLLVERAFGVGIFDPALGGDPILYQHFFWFYSHPAVYIMILPAMGIISEVISIFSRKHIFGYRFIACSSIAIALLGFLVWGHHMFTSGQSPVANAIFSLLTFSVSIPSAIKVFNWLATMYKGEIYLKTPMVYALSFIWLFTLGGLTGLFLGSLATDIHLHDTYFVVAHFHYVMVGSSLTAFLAGLHHWWPKMTGRMYSEKWGVISSIVVFIGFNVTFFVQFVLGSQGMPRRYADWGGEAVRALGLTEQIELFGMYHKISTVGSFIMGIGLVMVVVYLVHSIFRGTPAPANPWGGASLEWQCSSPPPHDNFAVTPTAGDPYALDRFEYDPDEGGYVPVETAPEPRRTPETVPVS